MWFSGTVGKAYASDHAERPGGHSRGEIDCHDEDRRVVFERLYLSGYVSRPNELYELRFSEKGGDGFCEKLERVDWSRPQGVGSNVVVSSA